ncbi:exodeoxyribonuclease VII large subunit [Pontibacter sp. 13R65]|uniref:exodeoxyribonuclease VII large subunit n=1 Tax=Pontibacter sp. 13R65 TaxID=3127458 RepID=UPI00301C465A
MAQPFSMQPLNPFEDFQSPLTLFELHQQIREELELSFPDSYWVVAEIAQVNADRSKGHCYLTLADKGDNPRGQMLAQARATIWSARYQMLGRYFQEKTGHPLKAGLKILLQAKVRFHELYGLSLDIQNIDPNYTIGDLARQRQETIKKLEAEGLLAANREHVLSQVPQRLAVVSSATAAGYQDFIHQLQHNPFGYKFATTLFPALVQGNEAPASVARAMQLITQYQHQFDACIIIRGGGSQTDLSCFDDYAIAAAIGRSPLPVLTGIGHERDESIADLVAHTRLKTPTAVANFLVERLRASEEEAESLMDSIRMFSAQLLKIANEKLERQSLKLSHNTNDFLQEANARLEQLSKGLLIKQKNYLEAQKHRTNNQERDIRATTKEQLHKQEKNMSHLTMCVEGKSQRYLHMKEHELNTLVHCLETEAKAGLKQVEIKFGGKSEQLKYLTRQKLQTQHHRLHLLDLSIKANDPEKLLLKGYTLTLLNGKIIKSAGQLKQGDVVETKLKDGIVHSMIVNVDKDDE